MPKALLEDLPGTTRLTSIEYGSIVQLFASRLSLSISLVFNVILFYFYETIDIFNIICSKDMVGVLD